MRTQVPYIIEIIGPPGSGKSTMIKELSKRSSALTPAWRFRRPMILPAIALALLRHPVDWIRIWVSLGRKPDAQIALLFSIAVQHQLFRLTRGGDGAISMIDQGPVYGLSKVRSDLPELLDHPAAARVFRECVRDWARWLDCVVRLDAEDETLRQRIHTRGRFHRLEGQGPEETSDFLVRFRSALDATLEEMQAGTPVDILNLESTRSAPSDMAARVLSKIDDALKERGRA